ncbi:MAG: hypothetical protein CMI96_00845 [Pelagibacteraceae bacterium]|nr:hypothetical protein [Pelagibacteraceae bacterium]|tara:strand:+ start:19506 stop:19994 length:489 start_codon:yes stop_codon:yes gene_type:complete
MRLFLFFSIFIFIWGCSTVEVTKEVIKATSSVKKTVEEILPKNEIQNAEKEEELIKAKEIIEDEQKKQKSIIQNQQRLAEINFIGNTEDQINLKMGKPELTRSDDPIYMFRYDSESCRLFIFFNNGAEKKRVEYFEIRNDLGTLLNSKQSLEQCYREFKLIN